MKTLCVLVLCALAVMSVAGARRRRSAAPIQVRKTPRVVVQGITDKLTLDCRPSSFLDNVELGIQIRLDRVVNDSIVPIAYKSVTKDVTVAGEDNRTTAEGHLRSSASDEASFLSVSIANPTTDDEGIYECKYVYLEAAPVSSIQLPVVRINVTVHEEASPVVYEGFDCDCDALWAEINSLKDGLVKENKELKAQLAAGGGGAVAAGTCQASFSARYESMQGYKIVDNQAAVFDTVISNTGKGYDPSSGIFTVPCDGQYYFTLTLRSLQQLDSGFVDGVIQVDGEGQARTSVFTDDTRDNLISASAGVVLDLKQGQQVNVVIKSTSSGQIYGDLYSIFSGFSVSA